MIFNIEYAQTQMALDFCLSQGVYTKDSAREKVKHVKYALIAKYPVQSVLLFYSFKATTTINNSINSIKTFITSFRNSRPTPKRTKLLLKTIQLQQGTSGTMRSAKGIANLRSWNAIRRIETSKAPLTNSILDRMLPRLIGYPRLENGHCQPSQSKQYRNHHPYQRCQHNVSWTTTPFQP